MGARLGGISEGYSVIPPLARTTDNGTHFLEGKSDEQESEMEIDQEVEEQINQEHQRQYDDVHYLGMGPNLL